VQRRALVQAWCLDAVADQPEVVVADGGGGCRDGPACLAQAVEEQNRPGCVTGRFRGGEQLLGLFERGAEDMLPVASVRTSRRLVNGAPGCAARPPHGLVAPRPPPTW
jgi:hypothetical protein